LHLSGSIVVAKTTFGFNSDHTNRQYAHGLLLESPFVPSSTDRLAARAKIRQNGRLGAVEAKPEVEIWWRPKNQLVEPGFLFTHSDSFYLGRTVSPQYKSSQTDDRRHTVPKARPIVRTVRSAKNHKKISEGHCSLLRPLPQ